MIDPDEPEHRLATDVDALGATEAFGIPGLVNSRALTFLPGHDNVYAAVLRRFATQYADGVPGLEACLEQGLWHDIGRALHSLRGACGAVGAVDLAEHCERLESAVWALADGAADPDDTAGVPPGLAALQATLRALAAAIDHRLSQRGLVQVAPKPAGQ